MRGEKHAGSMTQDKKQPSCPEEMDWFGLHPGHSVIWRCVGK